MNKTEIEAKARKLLDDLYKKSPNFKAEPLFTSIDDDSAMDKDLAQPAVMDRVLKSMDFSDLII